jgi:hypothetical protein
MSNETLAPCGRKRGGDRPGHVAELALFEFSALRRHDTHNMASFEHVDERDPVLAGVIATVLASRLDRKQLTVVLTDEACGWQHIKLASVMAVVEEVMHMPRKHGLN